VPDTRASFTRGQAFRTAWPMVFANAVVPLAGVVDTVVIGAVSGESALGGVALGTTLFNVAYFSVYFLRMSSTGLAARAHGAKDRAEAHRVFSRAFTWALVLGAAVVVLRPLLVHVGLAVLEGTPAVDHAASAYLTARAMGAPGSFALLAIGGWLIGVGRPRAVLAIHVVFSAVNVALDLAFVLGLGWGVFGVGAATGIAEVTAAASGFVIVARGVSVEGGFAPSTWRCSTLLDRTELGRLAAVNVDLMVRSWSLLVGFAWFINSAARHGADVLAGNHVLLQFVTLWAFVLDAWAFTAEAEVGRAVGGGSVPRLRRAVRVTSELALLSGVAFAAVTALAGPGILEHIVADPEARAAAKRFLPYCAAVPFIGAAAWQLDGIFIGATQSRALRNAAVASMVLYLALDAVLARGLGADGTWLAFLGFYLARAATLAIGYPALERSLGPGR